MTYDEVAWVPILENAAIKVGRYLYSIFGWGQSGPNKNTLGHLEIQHLLKNEKNVWKV